MIHFTLKKETLQDLNINNFLKAGRYLQGIIVFKIFLHTCLNRKFYNHS